MATRPSSSSSLSTTTTNFLLRNSYTQQSRDYIIFLTFFLAMPPFRHHHFNCNAFTTLLPLLHKIFSRSTLLQEAYPFHEWWMKQKKIWRYFMDSTIYIRDRPKSASSSSCSYIHDETTVVVVLPFHCFCQYYIYRVSTYQLISFHHQTWALVNLKVFFCYTSDKVKIYAYLHGFCLLVHIFLCECIHN